MLSDIWPTLSGEIKNFEESDLNKFFEGYGNKNKNDKIDKNEMENFICKFRKKLNYQKSGRKSPFFKTQPMTMSQEKIAIN